MKPLMIPIMLTAALVFLMIACDESTEPTTEPNVPTPPDTEEPLPDGSGPDEPFTASYADGVLTYSARIMTPTPCHNVRVEESILESFPVQVRIDVRFVQDDPEVMCAQVITERTVSGRITLSERPGSVTLTTPFETYEATIR